jgi:hypothetical protein
LLLPEVVAVVAIMGVVRVLADLEQAVASLYLREHTR